MKRLDGKAANGASKNFGVTVSFRKDQCYLLLKLFFKLGSISYQSSLGLSFYSTVPCLA